MQYEVRIDSPWISQRKVLVATDDPTEAVLVYMEATSKAQMPLGPSMYIDGELQNDEQLKNLAGEFITYHWDRWTPADPRDEYYKHFLNREDTC